MIAVAIYVKKTETRRQGDNQMARPTITVENWNGKKIEVTLREYVSRWTNQVEELHYLASTSEDLQKTRDIKDQVKQMAINSFWSLYRIETQAPRVPASA
tara:strand:+ start:130 stop:429 length:300 start_codon:yes stop_codon:yes gene_type:complete